LLEISWKIFTYLKKFHTRTNAFNFGGKMNVNINLQMMSYTFTPTAPYNTTHLQTVTRDFRVKYIQLANDRFVSIFSKKFAVFVLLRQNFHNYFFCLYLLKCILNLSGKARKKWKWMCWKSHCLLHIEFYADLGWNSDVKGS
jgi:hypothetical protein